MTMASALAHEWLSGPLSQPAESQKPGLGGDSAWSIESFESQLSDGAVANSEGRTTRPMTVSGTNLESGLGGDSRDSFSQPMGNLSLHTPRNKIRPNLHLHHTANGAERSVPAEVDQNISAKYPPPSPPLTADHAHEVHSSHSERILDSGEPHLPVANTEALIRNETSHDHRGSRFPHPMFDSGSLSPPPSINTGEPPDRDGANEDNIQGLHTPTSDTVNAIEASSPGYHQEPQPKRTRSAGQAKSLNGPRPASRTKRQRRSP